MLPPKVVAALVFIWIIGALLGGLYESSYIGSSEASLINKVLFYRIVTTEGSWGPLELAASPVDWMKSLWEMATFQFAFISGEAELVRWVVFLPLAALTVYGIVMTVIGLLRGTL